MKTSGINFCYKKRSGHPHEQENIHINTSHKTSTVQIVQNHGMRHFFSLRDSLSADIFDLVFDLVWRETPTFKMIYLKDGECHRAKNP